MIQIRFSATQLLAILMQIMHFWKHRVVRLKTSERHTSNHDKTKGRANPKKEKGVKAQRRQHNSALSVRGCPLPLFLFFLAKCAPAQAAHFARKKRKRGRGGRAPKWSIFRISYISAGKRRPVKKSQHPISGVELFLLDHRSVVL